MMRNNIAKRLKGSTEVIGAIKNYIAKANDDLAKEFEETGIINPVYAVDFVNDMEDEIAWLRDMHPYSLTKGFNPKEILEGELLKAFLKRIGEETLEVQYADMFHKMFVDYFDNNVQAASLSIDKDIVISDYTKKSKDWLASWSTELADIMHTSESEKLKKILTEAADNKLTVKEVEDLIVEAEIREAGYAARRVAVTETHRINNYALTEAMTQNPAVIGKEWVHAGNPREPRPNHVALDGVTIPPDRPFELQGADGGIYYPMAPHDSCLPVGEVANCGCTVRANTSKDITSKSPADKERLQRKRMRRVDDSWEKEFNEANKDRRNVNLEAVKLSWIKKKNNDDQIRYFGGGNSGKTRKALIDNGVIKTDADLSKLFKNHNGKRKFKTLTELEQEGIISK